MGFYGSNDPTDSVKALKEVVVLRRGFNPTRPTSPCYTLHMHAIIHIQKWINKNTIEAFATDHVNHGGHLVSPWFVFFVGEL